MTSLKPHKDISHTRLTPIRYVGRYKNTRQSVYLYQCECGNQKEIQKRCVEHGHTKSCGCLAREYRKSMKPALTKEARLRGNAKKKGRPPPNKGKVCIFEQQNNRNRGRRMYVTRKQENAIFRGELIADFENHQLIERYDTTPTKIIGTYQPG